LHETPKRGGLGGFSRFAGPFDEISGFSKKNPKKFSFGYLTATFDGLPRRPRLGQFHGFAGPFKIFGFLRNFSKNSEQGTFPFSHAGRLWGTPWASLLPECPCLHFFRRRGSVWGALGSLFCRFFTPVPPERARGRCWLCPFWTFPYRLFWKVSDLAARGLCFCLLRLFWRVPCGSSLVLFHLRAFASNYFSLCFRISRSLSALF
jgi:hypothetical protein